MNVILWKETAARKQEKEKRPLRDDEFVIGNKWRGKDVKEFARMWNCGLALKDIAKGWPDCTYYNMVFFREYAMK